MDSKPKSPVSVLVADDDPQLLAFARTVLEAEGCNVICVPDGKEAYKAFETHEQIDLAILGAEMPHIDGRDLVRHMRTVRRLMNIPVIITASELNSRSRVSSDSFATGALAFLPKPFTDVQLRTMLNTFVGRIK